MPIIYAKIDPNDRTIFKLDNAAQIYPYTATKKINQVFRVEALLDQAINYAVLYKALFNARRRCPTCFVALFCDGNEYKLRKINVSDRMIHKDPEKLCAPFDLNEKDAPLLRVTCQQRVLGLEFFHAVTDGAGAGVLMKTLLAEYYRLQGYVIPCGDGVLDCRDAPKESEMRDDFFTVDDEEKKPLRKLETSAFQYGAKEGTEELRFTQLKIPTERLKRDAKQYGLSITQFLTAHYLRALAVNRDANDKAPVKVSIPVNLRNLFGSETLRNFSYYFNVTMPESDDFSVLAASVKEQFERGIDKDKFLRMIRANLKQTGMLAFRIMPRFLRKLLLRGGYRIMGVKSFTSPLTNLGIFDLPDALLSHVQEVRYYLGATPVNTIYCTAIGYNGNVNVVISSRAKSHDAENYMISCFEQGGDVPGEKARGHRNVA